MTIQDAWLSAWTFAARVHNAQKVPGTDLPYVVHIGAVGMEILTAHAEVSFEQPVLAVQCALLHDTLEDTDTAESELMTRFGKEIANGVRALSKDTTLPKAQSMTDSLRRIRMQPREVWSVKLADRISNLAPPPKHWTDEKIATYAAEARQILAALGEAHEPLARRLAYRIEHYPPRRTLE